ncbi:WD40 repeat domain-containing serine/threonine-protein kinase [Kitasatospora sp. NPDC001261]|uniref:WD40 repeat domain-containing serine/threonine-protein kinase n=1 Tax=Kitasatospora sp. NPDC001261 TaxID=3364012 RepID=UPI0036CCBCD9
MPGPAVGVPAPWSVGEVVADQYRVLRVHTEGGMGVVYRVRHLEWDVDLAVKCPRPELFGTPEQQERFVREAETWVSLGLHPHVCGCHYVRVLDGLPRVFAEYLPGGSLREWIDDRRLYAGGPAESTARILRLAVEAAWGLRHAHGRGLVHQDVKPANVLLDLDGTAKVTDFGLAQARATGGERVSGGGMTMAYASPEQARREPLDHRTDLYSFAVSVVELFTGEVTWLMGPVVGEALASYRAGGGRGPGSYGPTGRPEADGPPPLPEPVAELLARCLRERPADRPASMAEVADELADIHLQLTGRAIDRGEPREAELRADELNNRAVSMLDLGRAPEAEAAFGAALAADPRHPEATYNSGLMHWRQGGLTDEDLLAALDAARADGGAAGLGPLIDAVQRERGAVGPAAEPTTWTVPWYEYERWTDSPWDGGRTRRAAPDIEIRPTPDGRLALTACDGGVKLWEVATGRCLRELDELRHTVDLDAEGRRAVGVGSDGLVRLFDLGDGRCLRVFTPYYRSGSTTVRSLRLLAEAGLVVGGTSDGTVLGWELTTGRARFILDGFSGGTVEATPDGRLLVFDGPEGVVAVRDPAGAGEQTPLLERRYVHEPCCLSRDGRTVAAAVGDRLRVHGPGPDAEIAAGHGAGHRLALSPDGRLLAGGGLDGAVRLWEPDTGRCLRTFRGHRGHVDAVVFLADGRHLLSAGRDGTARRWPLPEPHPAAARLSRPRRHAELDDLSSRLAALVERAGREHAAGRCAAALDLLSRARALPGHERDPRVLTAWQELARDRRVTRTGLRAAWPARVLYEGAWGAPALAPDGRTVAVRVSGGIQLLGAETGERGPLIEGLSRVHGRLRFTGDGRTVLFAGGDGTLGAWSAATGARLSSARLVLGAGTASFTADGRFVLARGADDGIRLFETATGACRRTLEGDHGRGPNLWGPALWLSPHGRTAVTAGPKHSIGLWDVPTGRRLREFHGHTATVTELLVDADRGVLLSGCGQDRAIRVWDLRTGACLRVLDDQPGGTGALRLSPDGRFVLSLGEDDGALRVWELGTGRCLRVLAGRPAGFSGVEPGPDGGSAVCVRGDGSVQLWCLDWELAVRRQS